MKKIAVTMGDPAGIGPEIILKSLQKVDLSKILLIGNRKIFEANASLCNIKIPKKLEIFDIKYDVSKINPAQESKFSGELAFLCLKKACELINSKKVCAVATAPLSKKALHLAGYNFSGQTEILQDELAGNGEKAQMLFVAEKLFVLLLSRHVSLKNVPKFVNEENIIETVKILNNELNKKFKIKNPKIAMCALNPHAGENGNFGSEEIKIINPALEKLREAGIKMSGAYSADTLLGKAVKNYSNPDFDAYVACYHDQALPAIKSLGLDKVLNITIGLKTLRSSPSHGTAFDIAYQNKADYKSMLHAIEFLLNLK